MDVAPLRHFLIVMGLSVVRLTAACSIVPFLGSRMIQGRVRNSIMFALAVVVYPMVAPTIPLEMGSVLGLVVILAKEIVLGILLGFLAAVVFWTAMSVGFFIDHQRGTMMASVFDPMSGGQTSPLGQFLQQTVIVLFYAGGGFLFFLGSLFESYLVWPVYSFYPTLGRAFPGLILEQADHLMRMTVVLAAPVIITMFLAQCGLGLLNRFAPQMNVFFLAMPIKSLIAIVVLVLYLPFLLPLLLNECPGGGVLLEFFRHLIS